MHLSKLFWVLSFPLKIQLFCGKLPLCVTWFYSLTALNTLFFFHIFSVLTPTWCGEFFWSCVFAILCASCARITLSFHPLEYFFWGFTENIFSALGMKFSFLMLIVIEFAFSWHTKILHALLTHLRKLYWPWLNGQIPLRHLLAGIRSSTLAILFIRVSFELSIYLLCFWLVRFIFL